MTRGKVVLFTLSHLTLFFVGAAWLAGYRTRLQFDAVASPRALDPRTRSVLQLAELLRQGRLDDAGASCAALGWPRCDKDTLSAMREVVTP